MAEGLHLYCPWCTRWHSLAELALQDYIQSGGEVVTEARCPSALKPIAHKAGGAWGFRG